MIGWAWITAIQVVDKYPHLSGGELAAVVLRAIHRREIDRRRSMALRNGRNIRWMREYPITDFHEKTFRSEACDRGMSHAEARVTIQTARGLLRPVEHGPFNKRDLADRTWKMLQASIVFERSHDDIGREFGVAGSRVGQVVRGALSKLRAGLSQPLGASPARDLPGVTD